MNDEFNDIRPYADGEVKQAVKDDEDAAKWAKTWFPDVRVEEE